MTDFRGRKGLIFIEDGSFLLDNRVQREVKTLTEAGLKITVICPRYPGETSHDLKDGVHIYRYRKWAPTDGLLGHICEYISSLLKGGGLSFWVFLRHGFHVFHACNPPDILFFLGMIYKLFGVSFLFDHHDVCPELYLARFRKKKDIVYKALVWLEKRTLKAADVVIATNLSYKRIEMERGGIEEGRIFVVRNGPDLAKFREGEGDPALREKGKTIVGYLGNMNPQDGVDYLLRAARYIKETKKRNDLFFVFVGAGDATPQLQRFCEEWNLSDICRFTGRLPDPEMLATLNACDICVQPDPSSPLNDVSTMNKIMEYMALKKPVVAFDLPETRYSGGSAALYAEPNLVDDLAEKIITLADGPSLMKKLGEQGRQRVEDVLCWRHSETPLREAYRAALQRKSGAGRDVGNEGTALTRENKRNR